MDENRLGISFSHKRNRLIIYRDVFRVLDNPGCFQLRIDQENNLLAIEPCKLGDSGFHIAPDFAEYEQDRCYELCSIELIKFMWGLCGWDEEKTYRIEGIKCPDIPVVIFELDEAVMITDSELCREE